MTVQNLEVKAGKMFCISRGEYSDYSYYGHFLALVDLSREMLQEVVEECNKSAKGMYDAEDLFLPALVRRGWVMDIDCREIHTGSYGELCLS